jgi:hypothetical protein
MILRADQQQRGGRELGRQRELQRPQEAADDQQPGQAEDEMENRRSPSAKAGSDRAGLDNAAISKKKQPATRMSRAEVALKNPTAARMPQADVSYLMT